MTSLFRAFPCVIAMLTCVAPSSAADFYQGKTLNFVINFTAGGPTDLEGRLIAKHLAKRLPGVQNVVVRNMGGAGGAIAINWLGEIAPPDGLNVGFFTGLASKAAVAEPSIRVDASKFVFVAGGRGVTVTFARSDIPPGLKAPGDIMKAANFWIGGLSPETDKDVRMRLQFDMLGLKYRYVTNYPGSTEARLALEQGEIQVFPDSLPVYRSVIEPQVAAGKLLPLWTDPIEVDGALRPSPDAAGIPAPTYSDMLIQQNGGLPSGPLWDAYSLINSIGTSLLRTITLSPGSPPEAATTMRAAIAAMNDDPEFQNEALAIVKFTPRYLVDGATERLYRAKLTPNPAIVSFLHDYIAAGRASLGK